MKCIYVAGAYSAPNILQCFANIKRGIEVSHTILKMGYAPFCPWLDFQYMLMFGDMKIDEFYNYTLAWLEKSDAMLLVPGYGDSVGTAGEIARAREINIPIFYDILDMNAYFKENP